ncbi:MAG: hypothetical protein RLZZ301_1243 [Bacteroidota bacterium]|jgi:rhodanese-related sulfurtransferase
MQFLSVQSLKASLLSKEPLFLLDIREHYEYEERHIEGHHMPMAEVSSQLEHLPKNQQIVLMCQSGRRAEALANFLETEYQLSNLSVLEGGLTAWFEANSN